MSKLIALSDGHGMQTSGKRTPNFPDGTHMKENEFNRRVVSLLDAELKRCGFNTLLVAPTDADTSLSARTRAANKAGADLYLSVHANAATGKWGKAGGIETLTSKSAKSIAYGKIYQKHLMNGTQLRDRGMKDGSWLAEVKQTTMPAVLVECGFMDNLEEAKLLMSESYRKECAVELAKATCEIFGVSYVPEKAPAAVKPASTNKKVRYIVQVGAFSAEPNATALHVKMKKDKITTSISHLDGLFKVICGGFDTEKEAIARKEALEKRGYKAAIIAR